MDGRSHSQLSKKQKLSNDSTSETGDDINTLERVVNLTQNLDSHVVKLTQILDSHILKLTQILEPFPFDVRCLLDKQDRVSGIPSGSLNPKSIDNVIQDASHDSQREVRQHVLPNILRGAQAGKEFTADFIKFSKGYTEADYSNRTAMQNARCTLMANRVKYFEDEFCKVVVDIRPGERIRATVRDAYERIDPRFRSAKGEVLKGSNFEWVIQVGNGIGRSHNCKKEARMIALVCDLLDPQFTGDAPARVLPRDDVAETNGGTVRCSP